MIFFDKTVLAALVGGIAAIVAACSDDSAVGRDTKPGTEAACEHINDVCSSTQGFEKQDCSSSNADYDKLSASEKAQVDAILPCVMASTTCQPALNCVRPRSNQSTSTDDEPTRTHDTEDACEHINNLCANEDGFRKHDCSNSNADYEKLSSSDKELADTIVPCIMNAESCTSAFQCLKFD